MGFLLVSGLSNLNSSSCGIWIRGTLFMILEHCPDMVPYCGDLHSLVCSLLTREGVSCFAFGFRSSV